MRIHERLSLKKLTKSWRLSRDTCDNSKEVFTTAPLRCAASITILIELATHAAQLSQNQQLHHQVGRLLQLVGGGEQLALNLREGRVIARRRRLACRGVEQYVDTPAIAWRRRASMRWNFSALASLEHLLQVFQRVLGIAVTLEHQARLRDGAAQLGGVVDRWDAQKILFVGSRRQLGPDERPGVGKQFQPRDLAAGGALDGGAKLGWGIARAARPFVR